MITEQTITAIFTPIALGFIGIEFLISKSRDPEIYSAPDTLVNLGSAILSTAFKTLFGFLFLVPLIKAQEFWNLLFISDSSIWSWVICLIAVDFMYYLFHWSSHKTVLWGQHAVHHQSEKLNLSVALRIPIFEFAFKSLFYLPLVLIGFPVAMIFFCEAIRMFYGFSIHTQFIKKFSRAVEWLFNTPSHHRVHHGKNPEYIDKNFGGILIIWDRIFGTFAEEKEKVLFGTLEKYPGYNVLLLNLQPWLYLFGKKLIPQFEIESSRFRLSQFKLFFLTLVATLVLVFILSKHQSLNSIERILMALALTGLIFIQGVILDQRKTD